MEIQAWVHECSARESLQSFIFFLSLYGYQPLVLRIYSTSMGSKVGVNMRPLYGSGI